MSSIALNRGEPRGEAATPGTRLGAAGVSVACAGMLGVGAWLTPDAAGHGTHTQLGLPACAWASVMHRPCPTCGMTTAVSLAAHGRLVDSFLAQPFGLLVALGAAVALWSGLHVAFTGSHLGRLYGMMMSPRVLWALAGLAGAAWAYKWVTWVG